jgi:hypothetical protein
VAAVAALVLVLGAVAVVGGPARGAGAQEPPGGSDLPDPPVTVTAPARPRAPIPILTVADATVERCGGIAVTGQDFAPDTQMTIAVNGTVVKARPITDADGSFTFSTAVECEQASGIVQIRASDATVTVAIDVAIGPAPTPLVAASTSSAPAAGPDRDLALLGLRLVLALVLVGELVVLWQLRSRRRRRRSGSAADVAAIPPA